MDIEHTPESTKLSIIIPVYNEQYTIEHVINEVLNTPLPPQVEREVLVVDDGSTDGTADRLRKIAEESNQPVIMLSHDKNRGKGAAIRTAIERLTGDIAIIQDADLEYSPHEFTKLISPILAGDADAVYGSRFATSDCRRVLFFWHSLGNKFLTLLSNLFTNLNLTDMETGYKAIRASILKSIPIRCNRFGIEPELTAKLARRDCRIFEVPITYRGRTYEEGKKITWRDGVKALGVILYFRLVDDAYNTTYGHSILQSLSQTHRFNRWMADTIKPWVGKRVLELGAGIGNITIKLLPREHYIATDIDPLALNYLATHFRDNPRVNVASVNLDSSEDFNNLPHQPDTVICLNVLEHIKDDRQALTNIYNCLPENGRVILLVPANPKLYGSLDKALDHVRRYTNADLKTKVEEAGFTTEELFSFNRIGVPGWYLNGILLKKSTFSKVQLKIYDGLVWLWKLLEHIFPWPGLSIILVASKPCGSK